MSLNVTLQKLLMLIKVYNNFSMKSFISIPKILSIESCLYNIHQILSEDSVNIFLKKMNELWKMNSVQLINMIHSFSTEFEYTPEDCFFHILAIEWIAGKLKYQEILQLKSSTQNILRFPKKMDIDIIRHNILSFLDIKTQSKLIHTMPYLSEEALVTNNRVQELIKLFDETNKKSSLKIFEEIRKEFIHKPTYSLKTIIKLLPHVYEYGNDDIIDYLIFRLGPLYMNEPIYKNISCKNNTMSPFERMIYFTNKVSRLQKYIENGGSLSKFGKTMDEIHSKLDGIVQMNISDEILRLDKNIILRL